jgi:hypothetical protein
MSPAWMQRRKRREEQDVVVDDEPMAMLDLSAYDVPPERRGAFRDAVAAGDASDTERQWTRTTREPSD